MVYFESSEDLDMGDIDISDILLVITRKISDSLSNVGIDLEPGYFKKLFGEIKEFLTTDIDLSAQAEFKLGLAKITAKTKDSPKLRNRLRDYLESRTDNIIKSVNEEILGVATQRLKQAGKEGLVVIVDNLDRIYNKEKFSGRTFPEYIFIDRGEHLKQLNCHLVYTIPLTLIFSNDGSTINNRFGVKPKVLAMIPVQSRNGVPFEKGLALLRQMVMARAFPDLDPAERLNKTEAVFEKTDMLETVCQKSGGHVRNLLSLVWSCLQKEDPPVPEYTLEEVIQEYRDDLFRKVDPHEWELLCKVLKEQSVAGEGEYDTLLRSMFVFEYQDKDGVWFGINPLLSDAEQLKQK